MATYLDSVCVCISYIKVFYVFISCNIINLFTNIFFILLVWILSKYLYEYNFSSSSIFPKLPYIGFYSILNRYSNVLHFNQVFFVLMLFKVLQIQLWMTLKKFRLPMLQLNIKYISTYPGIDCMYKIKIYFLLKYLWIRNNFMTYFTKCRVRVQPLRTFHTACLLVLVNMISTI